MKDEARARHGRGRPSPQLTDVVYDFAGMRSPDLAALCLLLTARGLADQNHRKVWLHALPEETWRLLQALGLEHYFEFLPPSGEAAN